MFVCGGSVRLWFFVCGLFVISKWFGCLWLCCCVYVDAKLLPNTLQTPFKHHQTPIKPPSYSHQTPFKHHQSLSNTHEHPQTSQELYSIEQDLDFPKESDWHIKLSDLTNGITMHDDSESPATDYSFGHGKKVEVQEVGRVASVKCGLVWLGVAGCGWVWLSVTGRAGCAGCGWVLKLTYGYSRSLHCCLCFFINSNRCSIY